MSIEYIQNKLFEKYYSDESFSESTSSHWQAYGEKTKVIKTNKGLNFEAYGLSYFRKNNFSFFEKIKNLSVDILLTYLLQRHHGQHKTIQAAKGITKDLNINFEFDHAKHCLIYDLLESYNLFRTDDLICIIGDGHGFFGSLIKKLNRNMKILYVNLGRNLLIDCLCFSTTFPELNAVLIEDKKSFNELLSSDIFFLESEICEMMENIPISLYINVASMQEMDMSVIDRYFKLMRTSTVQAYFYCCNREEKLLPDGSVIRFSDYPWAGEISLDELCPFYQRFPSPLPPFWRKFDGSHRHRLVKL